MADEEILGYIASVNRPVVGAKEIADEFDYSTTKGARKRLKAMREQGLVDRHKIGRVGAWWITDAGRERISSE